MPTKARTFVGETGTQAFGGFKGQHVGQRYTGVVQDDGTVLVSAVGAALGTGLVMNGAEWTKWFGK